MVRGIFSIVGSYSMIQWEWVGRLKLEEVDTGDYVALGNYLKGRRVERGLENNRLTFEFGWLTSKVKELGLLGQ